MIELKILDLVKIVFKKLFITSLVVLLLFATLSYFGYEFKSTVVNSVILLIINYLVKFSMLVSALNFENLDDYKLNSNLDQLMEKEVEFIAEHRGLTIYNAWVSFMSMMVNIAVFIYLIIGISA